MPRAPKLMSFATWLQETNRKAWHGRSDKKRSDGLAGVDALLQMYDSDPNPKPSVLEWLKAALDQWVGTKTTGEALKTMRDHLGAVTRLKAQVDRAVRLMESLAWDDAFPGIFIANDCYRGDAWVPDDFMGDAEKALKAINGKPVGAGMLKTISTQCAHSTDKCVVIEYTAGSAMAAPTDDTSNAFRKLVQQPVNAGGRQGLVEELMKNENIIALGGKGVAPGGRRKDYVGNTGSSAIITWNHEYQGPPGKARPPFIALAHELVHACHYVQGNCFRGLAGGAMAVREKGDHGYKEEEMRTVGFGKFADENPSENAIRKEHGLAVRSSYAEDDAWLDVVRSDWRPLPKPPVG